MDARIQEMAEAALRLVSRAGLGAVTFRAVAAESGRSLGAVQKRFASKQEMLAAVVALAESRVTAAAEMQPGEPDLQSWLTELAMQSMPVDEHRRTIMLITSAYASEAAVDPAQAKALAARDAELRNRLAHLFSAHRASGRLSTALDDETLTRAYFALTAGLAGQLLYDQLPRNAAREILSRAVGALLRPSR